MAQKEKVGNVSEVSDVTLSDALVDYLDETMPDVADVGRDAVESAGRPQAPSAAQIRFIHLIERKMNVAADDEVFRFRDAARAFIDSYADRLPPPPTAEPTRRQMDFALSIAREMDTELPEEVLSDRRMLSKWIDWNKGYLRPSDRQLTMARSLAERYFGDPGAIPEETAGSAEALSEWIDVIKQTFGAR